jgi:hypothetical protein
VKWVQVFQCDWSDSVSQEPDGHEEESARLHCKTVQVQTHLPTCMFTCFWRRRLLLLLHLLHVAVSWFYGKSVWSLMRTHVSCVYDSYRCLRASECDRWRLGGGRDRQEKDVRQSDGYTATDRQEDWPETRNSKTRERET